MSVPAPRPPHNRHPHPNTPQLHDTGMLGNLGPPDPYAKRAGDAVGAGSRRLLWLGEPPGLRGRRQSARRRRLAANGGGIGGGGGRNATGGRAGGAAGRRRLLGNAASLMIPQGEWPQLPCFLKQMVEDPSPMDNYPYMA
jgi:hypothetical protein